MRQFLQKIISEFQADPDPDVPAQSEHTIALAASVILLEIAAMDNDLADVEIETIIGILKKQYHLDGGRIQELLDNAEAVRKGAVDLYQFTRIINDTCSRDEKRKLMESIWRVIFADGKLDKYEDHLAHKLTRLLRLDHQDMIDAKLKARRND